MTINFYKDLSNNLSPNGYTQGRNGQSVLVAVVHNTSGPNDFNNTSPAEAQRLSDASANWLSAGGAVSIHLLVGAENCGAPIYRIVPLNSTAYQAGGTIPFYPSSWTDPDTGTGYHTYGLNLVSVGIELFGQPGEAVGPNQQRALKEVVLYLANAIPALKDPRRWVTHKSLEGDRQDGPNWINLAKGWLNEIGQRIGGTPVPTPTPQPAPAPNPRSRLFPQTGFVLNDPFLQKWEDGGGLVQFGYPISPEKSAGEFGLAFEGTAQYFERSRFEWHKNENLVMLGLVGAELLALKTS